MANGWIKSLQCKSRALDDVVHQRSSNQSHHRTSCKQNHLIPTTTGCRKSAQSLKDVVDTTRQKPRKTDQLSSPPLAAKQASFRKSEPQRITNRSRSSSSRRLSRASVDTLFPAVSELQEGHPSRNVVEIIFHTSWSPKSFSGRIEMVFKVQNLTRTVTRFEEYRETVKSRASSRASAATDGGREDQARCLADGNEVMRFHCLGPTNSSGSDGYDSGSGVCGAWAFQAGKEAAMCTFSGSGGAHESAGGGRGRRAMLVCRVIAGRVCKQLGYGSVLEGVGVGVGFDSVSGDNGELLVYDSRGVLPCFLIIYKL